MSDNHINSAEKEYHIFNLEMYAIPAFCSMSQQYAGTIEDYRQFIDAGLMLKPNDYFVMLEEAYN